MHAWFGPRDRFRVCGRDRTAPSVRPYSAMLSKGQRVVVDYKYLAVPYLYHYSVGQTCLFASDASEHSINSQLQKHQPMTASGSHLICCSGRLCSFAKARLYHRGISVVEDSTLLIAVLYLATTPRRVTAWPVRQRLSGCGPVWIGGCLRHLVTAGCHI